MKQGKMESLFNVLGYLCALFTKEKERECAINWSTAKRGEIEKAINKYNEVVERVLKMSSNTYIFNNKEEKFFEKFIKNVYKEQKSGKLNYEQIYLLILHIEKAMKDYSDWQARGVIYDIQPLNSNYNEVGIAFYPFYSPRWEQKKSERQRGNTFNSEFQHYFMIRQVDASPFKLVFHYWNDEGVLNDISDGWNLRVAMSPVMDNALINKDEENDGSGNTVRINGIENEEEVTARVERIFERILEEEYGIIVFPEVLGNENIVSNIKKKMQRHPEFNAFVLLPTICSEKKNQLIILGPGGIEVLKKEKATTFILRDQNGETWREQLSYTNQIDLLITRELGIVAFPICAEILEPQYYSTLLEIARVDFIVCASFSPGYQAFKDTMRKGDASKICCLWLNTCSAKHVSVKKKVPEVLATVQVPEEGDSLNEIKAECGFCCSKELCYFDVWIKYENEKFCVDFKHVRCA